MSVSCRPCSRHKIHPGLLTTKQTLPCDPEGSTSERGCELDADVTVELSMSRDVRRAFPSVRAASAILADNSIRSGTMIYLIEVVMYLPPSPRIPTGLIDIDGLDVWLAVAVGCNASAQQMIIILRIEIHDVSICS